MIRVHRNPIFGVNPGLKEEFGEKLSLKVKHNDKPFIYVSLCF
jgi:hypothetical protein